MLARTRGRLRSLLGIRCIRQTPLRSDFAASLRRSVAYRGDPARLQAVQQRAAAGIPICLGFLGGSITQGGNASSQRLRYADLVWDWWKTTFPAAPINCINAGIGGTATNYGAHRAWDDVLKPGPDVVVLEFAVNDDNTRDFAITLEGIVRQALSHPARPAVVLLSEMKNDGSNAQDWHDKVARHYGLTSLSVRDALWPEIAAGRMAWADVVADHIHPNDRGHRAAADILIHYFGDILRDLPRRRVTAVAPVPTPLLSDEYEHTHIAKVPQLSPLAARGWTPGTTAWNEACLEACAPGSELVAEFHGTSLHVLYHRLHADFGTAAVRVDDGAPQVLDGWYPVSGDGVLFCVKAAEGLPPGKHRMSITIRQERAIRSTGHRFQLIALMSAGLSPKAPNAPN